MMMIKHKLVTTSLAIGASLVSMALISKPAFAVALTYYQGTANPFDGLLLDGDSYERPSPKLFEVEGRVGIIGRTDYELAIGPEGANNKNTGQIYRDWVDGVPFNWRLTWNRTLGQAKFLVLNERNQVVSSIAYPFSAGSLPGANKGPSLPGPNANLPFNGFGLIVNAKTEAGIVDPDTNIRLEIGAINGRAVRHRDDPTYSGPAFYPNIGLTPNAILATATSPASDFPGTTNSVEYYFRTSEAIQSIEGSVRISWVGIDPRLKGRSRVAFKIKGYDPLDIGTSAADPIAAIPEPSCLIGLLGVTTLGASSVLKRKSRKDKGLK